MKRTMNDTNKELLKQALHDYLRQGTEAGKQTDYTWEFMMTVTSVFCAEDSEKGFLNFMQHINHLPAISKMIEEQEGIRSVNCAIYAIVQCASIIIGNGKWLGRFRSDYSYHCFRDTIIKGYEGIAYFKEKAFPVRNLSVDIEQAAQNDNISNLKLLIDLAKNKTTKLKCIYNYLLRIGKHRLAEKLHTLYGRMDELVFEKNLLDYWQFYIISKNDKMTPERFISEWLSPEEYPLHHLVLKEFFLSNAIDTLHNNGLLTEVMDVLWDSGISPDYLLNLEYPTLTFRKLMHFYFEFADDIQMAIQNSMIDKYYCEKLERRISEARHFVKWEKDKLQLPKIGE